MNVLVCSSKAFFSYLTVMLASLYENNRGSRISVYVLHSELESSDIDLLQAQARSNQNELHAIYIGDDQIAALPTRQQWPAVLYYRLMLTDVLPEAVDKILSLDIDIIIRKPLSELYATDVEQDYIAACEDMGISSRYKQRLQIPSERAYFNAGVMLLNVRKMREDGINATTFLSAIEERGEQLSIPDQDILNLVLGTKNKGLAFASYNCAPDYFARMFGSEIAKEPQFGSIIHYLSHGCKPWNTHVGVIGSEIDELWWDYAKLSPLSNQIRTQFEQKIYRSLVKENITLKAYYAIMHRWMQTENKKNKLENYFLLKGIHTIAIYGLSSLLEILLSELDGTQIEIRYLIDSFAKGSAYGLEVRNGSRFEDIDAIVVAASAHFHEIRAGLDDTCPVVSIDEVVNAIARM